MITNRSFLSAFFLPPFKQWPVQGHLSATAAATCKRICNRLHLQASPWKQQSSFLQCPEESVILCRERKKGIALLQSALNLLFMVGNGTQVDAYRHGLMLAAVSLDSTALSTVESAGWAWLGAQFSVLRPGTCVNTGHRGLSSTSLNISFVITRRSLCTASKCSAPLRELVAVAATWRQLQGVASC